MKYSEAGTAGHLRSPICRGLTAEFLGEMGKFRQPRALAERTAFLILLVKMVFPMTSKEGLLFTLISNPATPVLVKQHLDSWDSSCSRQVERFFHNAVLLQLVPLAKERHSYLDRITHPHVTFFAVRRLFIIFTI